MRKFPPPRRTTPITDGCMSSMLLMIVTVACPPLGVLGLICYGIYSNIKYSYKAKQYHQSQAYYELMMSLNMSDNYTKNKRNIL